MTTAQDPRRKPFNGREVSERITLEPREMPTSWYNIQADLPFDLAPPLSPATGKPVTFEEMAAIFPPPLIEQEMSRERYVPIPERVLDILSLWRPTPLIRARNLEKALGTPARIYYKFEGVSPAGSHKPNTAVPQAYFNKISGISRMTTETGAGQWGSSLAFACKQFDMTCRVYMVKVSFTQKPYRRTFIRLFGAEVVASPSTLTQSGRDILSRNPDSPGSLGIAISEAVEEAASRSDTNYGLGSVLNHVILHQSVIGLEAKKQMEKVGDYPDYVIGCHGGGSNFGGLAVPFVKDRIEGKKVEAIAAEPASCPTLTRVRLRLRGHGPAHPHHADVHPRPRFRPSGGPRRGAAVPRGRSHRERAPAPRPHRRRGGPPERDLRGGGPLRPHRGHHPRTRIGPRHRGGGEEGPGVEGGGPVRRHPLLPVGTRPL